MKQYKLLKDLPFHKAGEIFYVGDDGKLTSGRKSPFSLILPWADTNECLKDYQGWFEEIPEESKTVYDLKDGDKFWIVVPDVANVCEVNWFDDYAAERSCGLVYLTKEEAEKELAWLKAREILKRDAKGFKPDWHNKDQEKWWVEYDYELEKLDTDCSGYSYNAGQIYFPTGHDARESIKVHPNEWKTYLGVKE